MYFFALLLCFFIHSIGKTTIFSYLFYGNMPSFPLNPTFFEKTSFFAFWDTKASQNDTFCDKKAARRQASGSPERREKGEISPL